MLGLYPKIIETSCLVLLVGLLAAVCWAGHSPRIVFRLRLWNFFERGMSISDADWTSHDGHYRVQVRGEWVDVPDDAVITEPNRAGPTMVWPVWRDGHAQVICFMPGTMS